MFDQFLYASIPILTLIIGFVFGYYRNNYNSNKIELYKQAKELVQEQYEKLLIHHDQLQFEKEDLIKSYSRLETDYKHIFEKWNDKVIEEEHILKKHYNEFEQLANKIFENNSQKTANQNKEYLELILSPLKEKIQHFEQKIEISHKENLIHNSALKEQLHLLTQLNHQMNQETINLTKALKSDSKTQGNWGEIMLIRILEQSGLEKDREYFVQKSHINEEGKRYQPDVVIRMPENKSLVIDSKVSLTSYERMINADNESEYIKARDRHFYSIKNHIQQLSDKRYYKLFEGFSPDFVLLFIPIESALAVLIKEHPGVYQEAFDLQIILVTPTTLLATLKTVTSLWQHHKQHENAVEIARQAGALYDKFVGFYEDLNEVDKQLSKSQQSLQNAKNKLYLGKGNLVVSVEKLRTLGVKTRKKLDI